MTVNREFTQDLALSVLNREIARCEREISLLPPFACDDLEAEKRSYERMRGAFLNDIR